MPRCDSGANSILRVLVETKGTPAVLVSLMAHELRHAVEVAAAATPVTPTVSTGCFAVWRGERVRRDRLLRDGRGEARRACGQ